MTRTFETEKNNIPEGATHYRNQDEHYSFAWVKVSDEVFTWNKSLGWWELAGQAREINEAVKPIHKPEVVEWQNGDTVYVEHCTHDEIKFIGLSGNNAVAVCECITDGRRVILDKFWVSDLLKDKPETPEQKLERERLEAAYDLYSSWVSNSYGEQLFCFKAFCDTPDLRTKWLAIVDKINYRKGE